MFTSWVDHVQPFSIFHFDLNLLVDRLFTIQKLKILCGRSYRLNSQQYSYHADSGAYTICGYIYIICKSNLRPDKVGDSNSHDKQTTTSRATLAEISLKKHLVARESPCTSRNHLQHFAVDRRIILTCWKDSLSLRELKYCKSLLES